MRGISMSLDQMFLLPRQSQYGCHLTRWCLVAKVAEEVDNPLLSVDEFKDRTF